MPEVDQKHDADGQAFAEGGEEVEEEVGHLKREGGREEGREGGREG